jgi:hypothetical protein
MPPRGEHKLDRNGNDEGRLMNFNKTAAAELPFPLATFDGPLRPRIVVTHIWAVREGLRGVTGYSLFDGFRRRLGIYGMPLWRARTAMETLHPQWTGCGYLAARSQLDPARTLCAWRRPGIAPPAYAARRSGGEGRLRPKPRFPALAPASS